MDDVEAPYPGKAPHEHAHSQESASVFAEVTRAARARDQVEAMNPNPLQIAECLRVAVASLRADHRHVPASSLQR